VGQVSHDELGVVHHQRPPRAQHLPERHRGGRTRRQLPAAVHAEQVHGRAAPAAAAAAAAAAIAAAGATEEHHAEANEYDPADNTHHVIDTHLNPRFSNYFESYDVTIKIL